MTVPAISDPSIHNPPGGLNTGGVPPRRQVEALGNLARDSFLGSVAIGLSGINILGITPFAALRQWGQDRIDEAWNAYQAAMTAQSTVTTSNQAMYNTWYATSTAAGTAGEVQTVFESVKQAVINGFTVDTFTANGAWTVPANLTECWYVRVGGGGRGTAGQGIVTNEFPVTANGGVPGRDGGYSVDRIDPATLTAGDTVTVTVGLAAATAGADGAPTTIGAYSSTPGSGSIPFDQGYLESSSKPGTGGAGGAITITGSSPGGVVVSAAGEPGQSSARGAGGAYPGGAGATVSPADPVKCGGGGGAGGYPAGTNTGSFVAMVGGNGGDGGYPGGGSGGGGAAAAHSSVGNTAAGGQPGVPANGCAFILSKAG